MDSPVPTAPPTQSHPQVVTNETDVQHLKLLAIFYYVMAGLQLLGSCTGLVYLGIGVAAFLWPESFRDPGDPERMPMVLGGVMTGVGAFILLLTLTIGILQIMTGNALRNARRRTFCHIVAAITCLSVPLGTILGVFTFVVLARESVRLRFVETQRLEQPHARASVP